MGGKGGFAFFGFRDRERGFKPSDLVGNYIYLDIYYFKDLETPKNPPILYD